MSNLEHDNAIISMVLGGRPAAYAVLVSRYQHYVFTLAMRYVENRELAEELAQDVFVKAYQHLGSYKGESRFSTWLYTIVHTTCLSHLRRKSTGIVLPGDEHIVHLHDSRLHEQPAAKMEADARKEVLNKAIGHLPPAEAEVLTLFYLASQSVEEISQVTGATVANIKVRLFRARKKLKDVIEQRYKEELMDRRN